MLKKSSTLTMILSLLVIAVGLGLLAYIGFYNRYWQDDWCYNRDFHNLGVWGATWRGYFATGRDAQTGYSTNRYSLTLLSGLLYLPGIFGTQILAAGLIIFWLAGLVWIGSNLSRTFWHIPGTTVLLGAAFLLYADLYLSPQRFQVLYWRSGAHYSVTIIAGLCIAGLLTARMAETLHAKLVNGLMIPLAFMAGGLSEIGCAFLVGAAALIVAGLWLGRRRGAEWAARAYPAACTALLMLLASMVVLIVSPSNSRYGLMPVHSTSWLLVPFKSLEFSFNFIADSLKSLWLPHLVFFAFFASLSLVQGGWQQAQRPNALDWRKTGLYLAVLAAVGFLLIAAVQAPSIRFYSTPADPRGQSISRFVMLSGLAVAAWILGSAIARGRPASWWPVAGLIIMVLCTVYTARQITQNFTELRLYQHRAQQWDTRDAQIRTALAQGETRLAVTVIDTRGFGVEDVMPSKEMDKGWVTSCASAYYGLEAISAMQH